MACNKSNAAQQVRRASRRASIIIALVAALPSWFASVLVTDALFRIGTRDPAGKSWLSASFTFPLILAPIISVVLDAGTVLLLSARGKYRSDRWWLAGALFVVNALLAMAAVEVPTSGDWVYLHIMLSILSGYWIITFAAGALIWRRLTPTFLPENWLKPEDPEDE